MLAHNLKDILQIVPEAKEHIKQANIEEEFPVDNKDGALASCLRAYYLIKIAGKPVDPITMEKLQKAASLYGIQEEAKSFIQQMKKYAEFKQKESIEKMEEIPVKVAEANFEGNLTGIAFDPAQAMRSARTLMEKYAEQITSDTVKLYAGKAYFLKQAAIEGLETRAKISGNDVYTKIASLVDKAMSYDSTGNEVLNLCERVVELDKKAGLTARGFDFVKEALSVSPDRTMTALQLRIAGKTYPYEKFQRLGNHRIKQYLGKDVAAEMTHDPLVNKRIIETLPLDLQRVLASLLNNV